MKHFSRTCLWKRALPLASFLLTTASLADDTAFKIELIPTVVWQGQAINSAMINQVSEFHSSFPKLKIVHAINPRLLMNGANDVTKLQQSFGAMLNEDDGIAMHVSRLREWMVFARLTPTSGENLYGIVSDNCDELCGMDQSFVGIGPREFGTMITTGMTEMNRAGFGKPRIVIVEQGTLPETQWNVLAENGFKADWSGFNLDVVADRLKGFPIYAMNDSARTSVAGLNGDAANARGRSLDHMRFGVWLEAADLTKIDAVTDAAIALAKSTGRSVKLPLLVNASTLVHYGALMKNGVSHVYERVGNGHGAVVAWSGDDNSNWDVKKLGAFAVKENVAKSNSSEFSPSTVNSASAKQMNDAPKPEISAPAVGGQKQARVNNDANTPPTDMPVVQDETPEIVPSHSREMSH